MHTTTVAMWAPALYCIVSTHAHVVLGRTDKGKSVGRKNAATALDFIDKVCIFGPIKFIRSAQALTSQPGHSFAARSMIDGGCAVSRSPPYSSLRGYV